jgi:hypothetical protein
VYNKRGQVVGMALQKFSTQTWWEKYDADLGGGRWGHCRCRSAPLPLLPPPLVLCWRASQGEGRADAGPLSTTAAASSWAQPNEPS